MDTENITLKRLQESLIYDPITGVFTHARRPKNPPRIGSQAGTVTRNGYRAIGIGNRQYLAHRLAFLWMTGKWPNQQVDHINRNRLDNRWLNLRVASHSQNLANSKVSKNNTSGHKGVTFYKPLGKWMAQGWLMGKRTHIGYFNTLEEAANAATLWRESRFGVFAKPA